MNYHFSKTIESNMEQAVEKVTAELKKEGFGILMDIDIQKIFKEKIDVDYRPYRILGTCNPNIGHKVLQIDEVMGVFLPCHIVVQETEKGKIKISAIDPIAPMSAVANPELEPIGMEVQKILKDVIERL
ncbi:MAG: DUF302 domain-containing protein [Bacteroidota bacterium]|nr:DUF302 domain-containing protein [Bacteroidota bacterium]